MHKTIRYVTVILALLLLLSACSPQMAPTAIATATPVLTAVPQPTITPMPSLTPFPTASENAPAETFTSVGNVADLNGSHGISARAIVAGLQTLIIQAFNFDGKGPQVDVRLVKGDDFAHPVIILRQLEQRPYQGELILIQIPASVKPGSADSIAIYCPETGEVYAAGIFK
jgi:hypothetical protein